ncbi:hypothetical protein OSTOST_07374, partial [Ostertagia ostertagi]
MSYLLILLMILPWVTVCRQWDESTKELDANDIMERVLDANKCDIAQLEALKKLFTDKLRQFSCRCGHVNCEYTEERRKAELLRVGTQIAVDSRLRSGSMISSSSSDGSDEMHSKRYDAAMRKVNPKLHRKMMEYREIRKRIKDKAALDFIKFLFDIARKSRHNEIEQPQQTKA